MLDREEVTVWELPPEIHWRTATGPSKLDGAKIISIVPPDGPRLHFTEAVARQLADMLFQACLEH